MLEKKKIGGRMRRSHIPPGIKTNAMWSRLLNRRATSEPAPHRTSPKGVGGAVQGPLACRGPCTPQDHLIDALNPRHSRDQQKPKKHIYIHTYIHGAGGCDGVSWTCRRKKAGAVNGDAVSRRGAVAIAITIAILAARALARSQGFALLFFLRVAGQQKVAKRKVPRHPPSPTG